LRKNQRFLAKTMSIYYCFSEISRRSHASSWRAAGNRRFVETENDSLKSPQAIEIIRNGLAKGRMAAWARMNGQEVRDGCQG
jgi:hypothetical protein